MKKTFWERYIEIYKDYHGEHRDPFEDLVMAGFIVIIILVGYAVSKLL